MLVPCGPIGPPAPVNSGVRLSQAHTTSSLLELRFPQYVCHFNPMENVMKKFLQYTFFAFVVLFATIPKFAYACSDCEDEVCAGPLCGCIPNIGRCPPPIPQPTRFDYCNITNDVPNDKPSCVRCSSILSGDAGKADCLARHQGGYVQFGECKPSDCRTVGLVNQKSKGYKPYLTENMKNNPAPELSRSERAVTKSLRTEKSPVTATMELTFSDGKKSECEYVLNYAASKGKKNKRIQFSPQSETCKPLD
jgi:hypothetical protein